MTTNQPERRPPPFDQDVQPGGYAWWYLDAISNDGRFGLTLIAFVGSVFSPYYLRARSRGSSDPMDHCAINVALYGPGGRWCMTERGRGAVERRAESFTVGPSALNWSGESLEITVDEWSAPLPRRIKGRIRVTPSVQAGIGIELDPSGHHVWTPVWPEASVEVFFDHPDQHWSGAGYVDHNTGREPLERAFDTWFWLRAHTRAGPVVLYDTELREGGRRQMALRFDPSGRIENLRSPPAVSLPRSRWGVARPARSEDGRASLTSVWEDTPFYTRSLIETRLLNQSVTAVHESLSLRRFSAFLVQLMLPFRMPRRRSWPSPEA